MHTRYVKENLGENQEDEVVNRILLNQLLEELGKEERQLIYLRYFENKTQTEIGKLLGVSQVQISRTEKKILKKLRMFLETPTHNGNV